MSAWDDATRDHDDDVGDELADRESRMERRPVTCAVRLVDRNPGHVRVAVWAGRNEGARGHAGELVFRADEWMELVDRPGSIKAGRLVIEFDVLP